MRVLVIVGLLVCLWAPPAAADERAACQAAVDAMVASWPEARVAAPVTCVPWTEEWSGLYRFGKAMVATLPVPGDPRYYRAVAAHELGHAWDDKHFGSKKQRRYMRLRGITTGYWNDAAEDYADVFAFAMTGDGAYATGLVAPIRPGLIETLRAKHLLPK